jgi:ATP-binding cassette subfamily C (CFTR/MRP) protein 1
MATKSSVRRPNPEDTSGIISRIFYFWLNGLISLGNRKYLEESDLFAVPSFLSSDNVKSLTKNAWEKELKSTSSPSMRSVLSSIYSRSFWLGGLAKALADISTFGSPLVLQELLKFIINSRYYEIYHIDKPPAYLGYIYAALLFVIPFIGSLLQNIAARRTAGVGAAVRTALITAMMDKTLKLSASARAKLSTGKIINMMNTDISKIELSLQWFHVSWTSLIQIAIATGLLIRAIGPSALVGIAMVLLIVPLQGFVLMKMMKQRVEMVAFSDSRLKMTNEMLQGVRVLKFYNWENAFAGKIGELRQGEMAVVKSAAYLKAVNSFLLQLGPIFMSVLSFIVLGATRGADAVTADSVFSALVYFNLLRFPIIVFPMMVGMAADAAIAMARLDQFFLAEELEVQADQLHYDSPNAIEIRNAEFSWEITLEEAAAAEKKQSNKPTRAANKSTHESKEAEEAEKKVASVLKNIDLNITKGRLTAIVGAVGSGKLAIL